MRVMTEYQLKEEVNVLELAEGAIPRSFTIRPQGNGIQVIVMHVEHDPEAETKVNRTFAIVEPNTSIPDEAFYAGTVEDDRDTWHIFEIM